MEHYRIPPSATHITIPCHCPSNPSPAYTYPPFHLFPSSRNWTPQDLLGVNNFGNRSAAEIESFFQDWLYFSFTATLFSIVDVPFRKEDFTRRLPHGSYVLCTEELLKTLEKWPNWTNTPLSRAEWNAKDSEKEDWRPPKARSAAIIHLFKQVYPWVNRYCNTNRTKHSPLFASGERHWPMSDLTCLGIIVLGQTFSSYMYHSDDYVNQDVGITFRDWGQSHYLTQRLLEKGWCLGDIGMIDDEGRTGCSYYFSFVRGPRAGGEHAECTGTVCRAGAVVVPEGGYRTRHVVEGCGCEFLGVEKGKVEEVIQRGLRDPDGSVPLVIWSRIKETGEWGLEVREYNVKEKPVVYLALSHIWSDGLGNETANSLPRCQLVRIHKLIRSLYKDHPYFNTTSSPHNPMLIDHAVPFWMDTLCCPVGESYKHLRRDTIKKMSVIYARAERVLVLDNIIQQCPISMPVVERTATLYMSNWLRRLWTMQEGVLAKQLYFQFRGGAEEVREYEEPFQTARWADGQVLSATYRMPTNFLTIKDVPEEGGMGSGNDEGSYGSDDSGSDGDAGSWESLSDEDSENGSDEDAGSDDSSKLKRLKSKNPKKVGRDSDGDDVESLDYSINASEEEEDTKEEELAPDEDWWYRDLYLEQLRRRHTSRAADEPICIATLIGVDPTELFSTDDFDEKMEILTGKMKYQDQVVIFNTFPRLQKEGYRWAPRSWLGRACRMKPDESDARNMIYEAGVGLNLSLPGIKLGPVTKDLGEGFVVSAIGDMSNECAFQFRVWRPDEEEQWPNGWDLSQEYLLISHLGHGRYGDDDNARTKRVYKEEDDDKSKSPFEAGVDAVIARKTGEDDDGRLRCVHVCRALMWPGLRRRNWRVRVGADGVVRASPRNWNSANNGDDSMTEITGSRIVYKQRWILG